MSTFAGKLSLGFGSLALGACTFGMSVDEYAEMPMCSRLGAWASTCGSCLEGNGPACMKVSEAHTVGRDARIGQRTAELFAAKACELGSLEGCVAAGTTLVHNDNALYHRNLILARYDQSCEMASLACERGSQYQCVVAGECLLTSDRKQAQTLFENLCVDGSARACTLAGEHTSKPATAAAMYGRGCELGSAEACVGLAAAEQLGLGVARDPDDALVKFTYACGDSSTFAACNAVAGYLPVAWLGRARLGSGLGTTGLPAPDSRRLAALQNDLYELDRTAVAGFCLGDDGRAKGVKMLQTWGDPRVDALVVDAVKGGDFGAQGGVEHRCWWMTYRVRFP